MTWLENKLYVLYDNLNEPISDNVNRLRVFADHAPYEELPEGIVLEGIKHAFGMAASVATRAIFFSEPFEGCIWKLQIQKNETKRFPVNFMPFRLSVGQDDELFVIMDICVWTYSIDIFRLSDVSLVKSILLSKDSIFRVSCVAQSPNRDIVITYSTFEYRFMYSIGILSTDGEIIRTFNPESLRIWCPISIAIVDTGDIFVVDPRHRKISMLNSQLTDIQFISFMDHDVYWPRLIVYIKEKQQLLISEGLTSEPLNIDVEEDKPIHVFHLSPCNVQKREKNG